MGMSLGQFIPIWKVTIGYITSRLQIILGGPESFFQTLLLKTLKTHIVSNNERLRITDQSVGWREEGKLKRVSG